MASAKSDSPILSLSGCIKTEAAYTPLSQVIRIFNEMETK